MYLRDEGYPLPSGGILMSPWVDLTMCVARLLCPRPGIDALSLQVVRKLGDEPTVRLPPNSRG
mgnify:FL=1